MTMDVVKHGHWLRASVVMGHNSLMVSTAPRLLWEFRHHALGAHAVTSSTPLALFMRLLDCSGVFLPLL